jgi:hypothetical protein
MLTGVNHALSDSFSKNTLTSVANWPILQMRIETEPEPGCKKGPSWPKGEQSWTGKKGELSMERERNTNKFGQRFKTSIVDAVWEKAHPVVGSNPDKFRKDACGALMVKSSFGKDSQFGWEIDHILPISSGGKDDLPNLQPLHWKNNEGKADIHPNWVCVLKEN